LAAEKGTGRYPRVLIVAIRLVYIYIYIYIYIFVCVCVCDSVKRELFYNILIKFHIPMKLVRLIKM